MRNYLFIVFAIATLVSCSTSKKNTVLEYRTPLSANEKVQILGVGQTVPSSAKLIGNLKIGDTGFSKKCGYSEIIRQAQTQARSIGGNILFITEHKEPSFRSTCHQIAANVYYLE